MRVKSKARKRRRNDELFLLHGKNSWVCEDTPGLLLSTHITNYFSKCTKTVADEKLPIDIGNIQVKLECDIDIDDVDPNTCIFFGSDAYYSDPNNSVLVRSYENDEHATPHPEKETFVNNIPDNAQQLENRLGISGSTNSFHPGREQWPHAAGSINIPPNGRPKNANTKHLKTSVSPVPDPFKCSFCSRTFKYHSHYIQHIGKHTGAKPYECNRCGKTFTQSSNLARHLLSHSQDREGFECTICNARFQQMAHLKAHKLLHIQNPRGERCELCGNKFPDFLALRSHLATHVNEEKCFTCDVCGKTFGYHSHWSAHMATHDASKPFHCTTCGRTFVHEGNLKRHMLVHMSALAREKRQQQMNSGDEGPVEQASCPVCGKQFKGDANLKKHQRVWSHWEDML